MFMLVKIDGRVQQRSVRWKPHLLKRTATAPLRTRDGWARNMAPIAGTLGSRYFAFRQGGSWWRYDTVACNEPVAMPSQEAAEMWLEHRG